MADQPSAGWEVWQSTLARQQVEFEELAASPERGHGTESQFDSGFVVVGAYVHFNGPLRIETASRLRVTSAMMRLSPTDALERAIATQWFLDEQLLNGRRILLTGPGRQRQEVVLPAQPTRSVGVTYDEGDVT